MEKNNIVTFNNLIRNDPGEEYVSQSQKVFCSIDDDDVLVTEVTVKEKESKEMIQLAPNSVISTEQFVLSESRSQLHYEQDDSEEQVDAKSISSMEKAFSIELIFTEIFKGLTVSDLLRCSLVSQKWSFNARSVLRDYKKCFASINCKNGRYPCENLVSLHNLLRSSKSIPFNGLIINPQGQYQLQSEHSFHGYYEHHDTCAQLKSRSKEIQSQDSHIDQNQAQKKLKLELEQDQNESQCVHKLYPVFFEEVHLKYLKFYWKEENVCYNLSQFILTLLTAPSQSGNLFELSIGEFPSAINSLDQFLSLLHDDVYDDSGSVDDETETGTGIGAIISSLKIPKSTEKKFFWPKLKSLELPTIHYSNYIDASVLNDFLQAAPHLQILRGHIIPEYLDCIFTSGKMKTLKIKEFVLAFPPPAPNAANAPGGWGGINANFHVHDAIDKLLESALKFAQLNPSLEKLSITTSHDRLNQRILRQNPGPAVICEILKQLFANSYLSLEQLQLDYQDFKCLTRVEIISPLIPLSRLTSLTLKYDDSIDFYAHFNFVDLVPLFPSLEKIEFIGSCFTTRGFYLASLFRDRCSGFNCGSVRTLTIFHLHIFSKFTDADGRFVRRISEFFPNVQDLHLDDYGEDPDFFDIVWSVWPGLEVIHFYNVPEHITRRHQEQQQLQGEAEGGGGGLVFLDPFFDGMRRRIKTFYRTGNLNSTKQSTSNPLKI